MKLFNQISYKNPHFRLRFFGTPGRITSNNSVKEFPTLQHLLIARLDSLADGGLLEEARGQINRLFGGDSRLKSELMGGGQWQRQV